MDGVAKIDGKYIRPAWSPPADIKRDKPRMPDLISRRNAGQSDGRGGDDARR